MKYVYIHIHTYIRETILKESVCEYLRRATQNEIVVLNTSESFSQIVIILHSIIKR